MHAVVEAVNIEQRIRRVVEAGWGRIVIDPTQQDEAIAMARKYTRCGGIEQSVYDRSKLWVCTSREGHSWDHFEPHVAERVDGLEADRGIGL